MSEDEMLDLVDDNDVVIGKASRVEIYAKHLSNFRGVSGFIKNSRGELWIPLRIASKAIFPSCLDMSVAGHVESGETYAEAFKREAKEELNINVDDMSFRLLGKLNPREDGISHWDQCYEIESDEEPHFNHDDFVSAKWYLPKDLLAAIAAGEKCKSDLPILVRHFYA
jgi:isopentenyldiphosphate isomerase